MLGQVAYMSSALKTGPGAGQHRAEQGRPGQDSTKSEAGGDEPQAPPQLS